jgi:hypothetical protein
VSAPVVVPVELVVPVTDILVALNTVTPEEMRVHELVDVE